MMLALKGSHPRVEAVLLLNGDGIDIVCVFIMVD